MFSQVLFFQFEFEGATSSSAAGLLPALCLGIMGGWWWWKGTLWDAGLEPGVEHVQGKLPPCCVIAPITVSFYMRS